MKKYLLMLVALMSASALAADPPAPADDGMGGDLGGSASAEVIDWMPAIRSLYVESVFKNSQAQVTKATFEPYSVQTLPSEWLQWQSLQKLIERKGPNGTFPPYAATDPIISGWKYEFDPASGASGYLVETAKADEPPLIFLRDSDTLIRLNFDVIMTTDPDRKREYLNKYFHFVVQDVSIWPVEGKLDAAVRDPKSPEALATYHNKVEEAPAMILAKLDATNDVIRTPICDPDGNLNLTSMHMFNAKGSGVFEIRARIVVSGKLPGQDTETVKEVQTAIRVAFLDNTQWDFHAKFESSRGKASRISVNQTK